MREFFLNQEMVFNVFDHVLKSHGIVKEEMKNMLNLKSSFQLSCLEWIWVEKASNFHVHPEQLLLVE